MIYYDSSKVNDWYRTSSAITKMMYNGKQAYRRVTRVLPTRWVTDSTSYLCVSTDKHEKQVKQYSLDDGITWTNYVPEISRPGNIIFSGSVDCGAAPQERWAVDPTSYICDGYDKYEKAVKQYCLDDYGISWANFVPEVSRKGNLIKVNARQCGYTADTQEPCYAVVDVISAYTDNEFEDVYTTSEGKWYKRNNLNSYEEYGVYGDSIAQTATTYPGKLAIYDGYEYIYSGNSWQSIGEVSGSTATLPNVPFSLNYNAKNYDATTHTIAKTTGQLIDMDATAVLGSENIVDHSDDGYITISGYASMKLRNQYDNNYQYLNRSDSEGTGEMTVVSKAKTADLYLNSLITNRSNDSCYNWMYRQYGDHLTLHGSSEFGQISCSDTSSDVLSVRTYYDNGMYVQYNNWTQDTSTSPQAFSFGCTDNANYTNGALFVGYGYDSTAEPWLGDFYWIYMSQHTLTDAEIEQVIAFNEEGTTAVYPRYYDEMQAPPSVVTFSSMTEAEDYECPYVGMDAVISGVDYIFSEEYNWVTKYQWVTVPNDYICYSGDKYTKQQKQVRNVDETWSDAVPAEYRRGSLIESGSTDCPAYTLYEYIKTVGTSDSVYKFDTGVYVGSGYTIEAKVEFTDTSVDWGSILGWCEYENEAYSDHARFKLQTVTGQYCPIVRTGDNEGLHFSSAEPNKEIVFSLRFDQSYCFYTIDGVQFMLNYNYDSQMPGSMPSQNALHLFGLGNIDYRKKSFKGKIYYVKVYDGNDTLVNDFRPSDNNGEPCFFDIMNGTYVLDTYTGEDHGTLTLGDPVV